MGADEQPFYATGYKWEVDLRLIAQLDALHGPVTYHHDELANLARAAYPDGSTELRMPDAVGNLFRTATAARPTAAQRKAIDANKSKIRGTLKKIGSWLWYHDQQTSA
jgi:hypothetical protein